MTSQPKPGNCSATEVFRYLRHCSTTSPRTTQFRPFGPPAPRCPSGRIKATLPIAPTTGQSGCSATPDAMKVFERVLDARLSAIATTAPNQCGFVKGSSTSDAIHAVRILLERHREKTLTVHTSFLDLEKAFDRVPHDLIWHALRSHGVPETYVRWVKLLYSD